MDTLALFFLAGVAIGGVAWVFLYPLLSGERKAEQRMASVARSEPSRRARARRAETSARAASRSKTRSRNSRSAARRTSSVPLSTRLAQAGLNWSKQQFLIVSGVLGVGVFVWPCMCRAADCWRRSASPSPPASACRAGC